jgi:Zn-dependent protease with chaperone function
MRFERRWLLLFLFAIQFIGLPISLKAAQSAPVAVPAQHASAPAYSLPPEKLVQAITLSHIRIALHFADAFWGLAVLWMLLTSRAAAGLSAWTERVVGSVRGRRWLQGLLFFSLFLLITALASLPFEAVAHLVSRHYGISVQGWGGWLADVAKSAGLSVLFGAPLLQLFHQIVRASPRRYWLWLWIVALPLIVLITFAEPLLDPVFNQFEPLAQNHATLVAKLETVVARTGAQIAPQRMFLMKASAKSTGINAYVTGLGATKRYVMWDTAINRLPDDEVLFIFGHESGHYVLNHIPQELAGAALGLFFVFWGSAAFAGWLTRRFGAHWRLGSEDGSAALASRQGFLALLFAFSVASLLLEPVGNTFKRHFEHQADVYGQEAIHGLVADPQKTAVSAFNHLGEAWLEDPNPAPFIEFWEYSHPSVQSRANFAAHYDPWANGGHGRFFSK